MYTNAEALCRIKSSDGMRVLCNVATCQRYIRLNEDLCRDVLGHLGARCSNLLACMVEIPT